MDGSKLTAVVHQTWERARSLRQDARESRWQAQAIKARARQLLACLKELQPSAEPAVEIQPVEPTIKPVRQLFEASRRELLTELKQTLGDLETLRMTPQDDPVVRGLTADIRKTIAQGATNSSTFNRPRRTSPSSVGIRDRE